MILKLDKLFRLLHKADKVDQTLKNKVFSAFAIYAISIILKAIVEAIVAIFTTYIAALIVNLQEQVRIEYMRGRRLQEFLADHHDTAWYGIVFPVAMFMHYMFAGVSIALRVSIFSLLNWPVNMAVNLVKIYAIYSGTLKDKLLHIERCLEAIERKKLHNLTPTQQPKKRKSIKDTLANSKKDDQQSHSDEQANEFNIHIGIVNRVVDTSSSCTENGLNKVETSKKLTTEKKSTENYNSV